CDRAGACGTPGTHGTCKARPASCPKNDAPACGCDGAIYPNACLANAAGIDVGGSSCAPETGTFFCGKIGNTCDARTSYCPRSVNDVVGPGQPSEFDQCVPLPASCVTDTACSCFPKDTPCLFPGSCQEIPIPNTATYGLQITCLGG